MINHRKTIRKHDYHYVVFGSIMNFPFTVYFLVGLFRFMCALYNEFTLHSLFPGWYISDSCVDYIMIFPFTFDFLVGLFSINVCVHIKLTHRWAFWQILEGLLKLPENRECADCKAKYVLGCISNVAKWSSDVLVNRSLNWNRIGFNKLFGVLMLTVLYFCTNAGVLDGQAWTWGYLFACNALGSTEVWGCTYRRWYIPRHDQNVPHILKVWNCVSTCMFFSYKCWPNWEIANKGHGQL